MADIPFLERIPALVGMVHVAALPGTPRHSASIDEIVERAARDAESLANAGFDAILIENMHDVPYLRRDVGPEIVAGMTAVGRAVRSAARPPLGVQILAGANRAALAVAQSIGADFIRAEGFSYASVSDEGLFDEADAGELLRYRKSIGADEIALFADVQKKHGSHAITADLDIAELARGTAFCGADGIVVTGTTTGAPTAASDLESAKAAVDIPVLAGSGGAPDNLASIFAHADGLIVGSWIKRDGDWRNDVDPDRAARLVEAANGLRA